MTEEKSFEKFISQEENLNVLTKINANEMEQSVYTRNSFPTLSEDMCIDISAEFRRMIKAKEIVAVICDIAHGLNGWKKTDGGLIFTKTAVYYVAKGDNGSFYIPYEEIAKVDFDEVIYDPEHVLLQDGGLNYERLAEDVRLYNLFMQEADPEQMVDENATFLDSIMNPNGFSTLKRNICKNRSTNLAMLSFTKGKSFLKDAEKRVKKNNGWGKKQERLILVNKDGKKFHILDERFNVRVMYNFFMDYLEYIMEE